MFKDVVVLLLGPNYKDGAMIMPFLVFTPLMYIASETTAMGIDFYKKVRWHLFVSFIVLIVNIVGNLLLVPLIGAKGAAMSTGLSSIVFFVLRTHISLKYYKIGYYLSRFYFLTLVLVAYAFYSTFYNWNMYNFLFGFAILILVVALYFKNVKVEVNRYILKK